MKIMSLNAWVGKRGQDLFDFVSKTAPNIDVFCFQEIFSSPFLTTNGSLTIDGGHLNLLSELSRLLVNHTGLFSPSSDLIYQDHNGNICEGISSRNPCSIGNAMFIRKSLQIEASGDIFINGNRNSKALGFTTTSPKAMQYAVIVENGKKINVFNVHGLWDGGGKKDSPERLAQSRAITTFLRLFPGKIILLGDFNLDPETESIRIIEGNGKMLNLISKFGVSSTRTRLYRSYTTGSKFADYCFVSPDVKILDFKVDPAEVSDHSPLILDSD
ncbi:MAG: endonuclease/exonuclease/phosphatase family protein [Candidatus Vogelbacteria bacterium]|nr:endonuclease/exonuclease/phosphatase family protein [Candidatus Vogelbacteria bacterium]